MSDSILPDGVRAVKGKTRTRAPGSEAERARAELARVAATWTIAGIRRDYRGRPARALLAELRDLVAMPLPLRMSAWGYVSALALELGERAETAEAAAGEEGAA